MIPNHVLLSLFQFLLVSALWLFRSELYCLSNLLHASWLSFGSYFYIAFQISCLQAAPALDLIFLLHLTLPTLGKSMVACSSMRGCFNWRGFNVGVIEIGLPRQCRLLLSSHCLNGKGVVHHHEVKYGVDSLRIFVMKALFT